MNTRRATTQYFLTTAAAIALFAACQAKNPADPAPPVDQFQGAWESSCIEGKSASLSAVASVGITQRTKLKVDGKKIIESSVVSSRTCDSRDIEISSDGSFERQPMPSSALTALDVSVSAVRVKPVTEFGVRVLSIAKWCGVADWSINQERDVTAAIGSAKCFQTRSIGTVYSVEGGQLYFGNRDAVTSSSSRPLELKKEIVFTKYDDTATTQVAGAGK